MRSVWKFPIQVTDEFTVEMPAGARVLHVETQYAQPCLWALVDPDAPREQRTFYVHGTGHPMPEEREHIGSFLLYHGTFVGHVFQPQALTNPAGGDSE